MGDGVGVADGDLDGVGLGVDDRVDTGVGLEDRGDGFWPGDRERDGPDERGDGGCDAAELAGGADDAGGVCRDRDGSADVTGATAGLG